MKKLLGLLVPVVLVPVVLEVSQCRRTREDMHYGC